MNNWKFYKPEFPFLVDCADHIWFGHIFFAYDLIRNIRPATIVELGTYYGTSISSMAQAVKDGNLSTKIFAIDCWEGDEHAGYYGNYVYEHVQALVKKYYSQINIFLVRKYFDQALSDFEEQTIDILHIDGLHTYDAVKKDYENWLPKMKPNGVILFHDIFVQHYGVKDLWAELKQNSNFRTIEFPQSYGLGVLFLDKSVYSRLFKSFQIPDMVQYYVKTAKESVHIEDVINAEVSRNIIRAELEKTIHLANQLKTQLYESNSNREALNQKLLSIQDKCQKLKDKYQELQNNYQELTNEVARLRHIESRKSYKILRKVMEIIGKPL